MEKHLLIERHRAIVRMSHELLRTMLFPEGTEILAVSMDLQDVFGRRDFVCVIEHPDLSAVKEGYELPEIKPSYRSHYTGIENEIPTVEFMGWDGMECMNT